MFHCVKQRHLNIYHVMPVKSHNVVGLLYAVWHNVQAQLNSEVPYCQFHWSYYFTDLNLPIKPSAPDLRRKTNVLVQLPTLAFRVE